MKQDTEIARELQSGNAAAIGILMDRYAKLLYKIAAGVLAGIGGAEDAEECAADVFIALWQSPERYDPQRGSLKTYLVQMTKSRAIDRYRMILRRREAELDEETLAARMDLLGGVLARERAEELWAAMEKLSEREREVLLLRYEYDRKPREIADTLGLSRKQTENLLYLTKRKLRGIMEKSAAETSGKKNGGNAK